MGKLRNQLQQARTEYREGQYPGDLAAELLRSRGSSLRWIFRSVLGGAVAAALALVALNPSVEPRSSPGIKAASHVHHAPAPTPVGFARLPSRMPLSLPASPFLAATPPVLVSLSAETFDVFQQPYEDLGPKLLE